MQWYWWVALTLQFGIDVLLAFFVVLLVLGHSTVSDKINRLRSGMFAVAEAIDRRAALVDKNIVQLAKAYNIILGIDAIKIDEPESTPIIPPDDGPLKN